MSAYIRAVFSPEITESASRLLSLNTDTIKAAIDIHKNIYDRGKYIIGFQYEMLEKSSTGRKINIDIIPNLTRGNYWEKLIKGDLDVIVTDDIEEIPETFKDKVLYSIPVGDNGIWVVRKDGIDLLEYYNNWIAHYSNSPGYQEICDRYFRKSGFSPYEFLIKEKSRKFGWDWRLLAAIIYQESKFAMHAKSHVGAVGLMQIMPSTARHYSTEDIFNPKVNIEVGILHLDRLQRQFLAEGMDNDEALKFTLAAYNAGEGKISNCRERAYESGYDISKWDEVSKVLTSEQIIGYVDSVINKYEEFKLIAKR